MRGVSWRRPTIRLRPNPALGSRDACDPGQAGQVRFDVASPARQSAPAQIDDRIALVGTDLEEGDPAVREPFGKLGEKALDHRQALRAAIEGARAIGCNDRRILLTHVLPGEGRAVR